MSFFVHVFIGALILFSVLKVNADVFILKSKGACPDCAEKIVALLKTDNIQSKIIPPRDLKAKLTNRDVLIVPGGDSEWDIKQDLLKVKAFKWIKNFIAQGGTYIGFCAGAYLAEKWILPSDSGLDIFPGEIKNYTEGKKSQALEFIWEHTRSSRWMFFQDGPAFYPNNKNIRVLARFAKDQAAAAVIFDFGKGKVGLISPHPEADKSWYQEDSVTDPDSTDFDLGLYFIRETINHGISIAL